ARTPSGAAPTLPVPQPVEFLAAARRAVPCGDDEYSGHVRPPANGVGRRGITSSEIATRQSDRRPFFRQDSISFCAGCFDNLRPLADFSLQKRGEFFGRIRWRRLQPECVERLNHFAKREC